MSDKNKNRTKLSDFIRYRMNEMTPLEKNEFERELQKDPFSREAEEGFSDSTGTQINDDMRKLRHSLAKRTGRNRRIIAYRIAASIAVLMVISSVFIVIRDKPVTKLPLIAEQTEPAEIKREQPVFEKPVVIENAGKPALKTVPDGSAQETLKKEETEEAGNNNEVTGRADVIATEKVQSPQLQDEKKAGSELVKHEEKTKGTARSMIPVAGKSTGPVVVSGKVLSAEDSLPVQGASVVVKGSSKGAITDAAGDFSIDVRDSAATLVASFIGMKPKEITLNKGQSPEIMLTPDVTSLSEVVITGYGVRRNADDEPADSYLAAQPEGGRMQFDRYIRDNIHRPDSSTEGQRVVVVAVFMVRADGSTDSLRIERSPSNTFSDEALRLIRQGPSWHPAQRNGMPVDQEVRVRIVFR